MKNEVHRRLVLGNAVVDNLRQNTSHKKTKHETLVVKTAATIIKKYRCIGEISKELGISRKKMSLLDTYKNSLSIKQKYGEKVRQFLEREDNSTLLPGKRDAKMKNSQATQKRVLNDYLHNLHQKFLLEFPETKLSRSSFCKLRPVHILLTIFSSRRTCLCTYHQNFALKIKSMQREGLRCSGSPDIFIKEYDSDEKLATELRNISTNAEIKYRHWKKVVDGNSEVQKYRWKEVEETVTKADFISIVMEELAKFRKHVERVQNQYKELRRLREDLPQNEILLWMDFAENYNCSSVEAVQSTYWNAQTISLHTMVAYFPDGHHKTVQSYVAVSDSISHNATVVYCILQKVVPLLKEDYPGLKRIHYLTDSPSSQYRNDCFPDCMRT